MSTALYTFLGVSVVALSGLAGTLGASWIAKRAEARAKAEAARIAERQIDREEFDSITRELRAQLVDVREQLADEKAARAAAEKRAETAEQLARDLEARVAQLEQG